MEEKQTTINAISCLAATLDALGRAGKKAVIDEVVSKMQELVKRL